MVGQVLSVKVISRLRKGRLVRKENAVCCLILLQINIEKVFYEDSFGRLEFKNI
jgi:hypothetical protein